MTRERAPLQWATTQNSLGNALATLGERESGTAQLEAAVTAYRAALKNAKEAARLYKLAADQGSGAWPCDRPGRQNARVRW